MSHPKNAPARALQDGLTETRKRALLDILTHYETYAEFEGISAARAVSRYSALSEYDGHAVSGKASGASAMADNGAGTKVSGHDDDDDDDDDKHTEIIFLSHKVRLTPICPTTP